jgi:hypothetical protein
VIGVKTARRAWPYLDPIIGFTDGPAGALGTGLGTEGNILPDSAAVPPCRDSSAASGTLAFSYRRRADRGHDGAIVLLLAIVLLAFIRAAARASAIKAFAASGAGDLKAEFAKRQNFTGPGLIGFCQVELGVGRIAGVEPRPTSRRTKELVAGAAAT